MHEIASRLIQIETQLRFFHWQTKSYARHQAYGGTYDAMADLIDSFVEVLMGKYGRVPAIPFEIVNSNAKDINSFIEETNQFLIGLVLFVYFYRPILYFLITLFLYVCYLYAF